MWSGSCGLIIGTESGTWTHLGPAVCTSLPPVHLLIHLPSIHPSCLSFNLSIFWFVLLFIHLSMCMSVQPCVPSMFLPVCLSIHASFCTLVPHPVCPSIHPSVCCPLACLSIHLSVFLHATLCLSALPCDFLHSNLLACLSIDWTFCTLVSLCLSIHLALFLHASLYACPSLYPSVCDSTSCSTLLSIHLSTCQSPISLHLSIH